MKKSYLFLAAALALSLSACGTSQPAASSSPSPSETVSEEPSAVAVIAPAYKTTVAEFITAFDPMMTEGGFVTLMSITPKTEDKDGLKSYSYDVNSCGILSLLEDDATKQLCSIGMMMDASYLTEQEILTYCYAQLAAVEVIEGDNRTAVFDALNIKNLTETAMTTTTTDKASYMYNVSGKTLMLSIKLL